MKRRTMMAATAAAAIAPALLADEKPALLGGSPVRRKPFPDWPRIADNDEAALMKALRSGRWNRNAYVERFEETWAKTLGARECLALSNGMSALYTAVNALGVGPGDEVIVPPYTFVATINAVLMQHALPVFVDSDIATFQIDAGKIEAAITPRTRCIVPVHLGGSAADMDAVLAVAQRHRIPVIEDACQAHLAEWRAKKVSTLGDLGCFSFQASKNLNCGEGGALISNNADLMAFARSFQNQGRSPRSGSEYIMSGCNVRMTEFQAAILGEQLTRLEAQSRVREQNARYLTGMLQEIRGIAPAKMYEGCTRNAYHLYMFRYDAAAFAGLPRDRFLKALSAEGVPCSGGYQPLNREPFLARTLAGRAFRRIYGEKELADYAARNTCPTNDRLCNEAVWLTQTMLLGPREDMDQIAEAVRKVQRHAASLRA
jgi:dTDP-4-amino-4,6-dideoxygalactose transaminase